MYSYSTLLLWSILSCFFTPKKLYQSREIRRITYLTRERSEKISTREQKLWHHVMWFREWQVLCRARSDTDYKLANLELMICKIWIQIIWLFRCLTLSGHSGTWLTFSHPDNFPRKSLTLFLCQFEDQKVWRWMFPFYLHELFCQSVICFFFLPFNLHFNFSVFFLIQAICLCF